jgi:hypothetical protein
MKPDRRDVLFGVAATLTAGPLLAQTEQTIVVSHWRALVQGPRAEASAAFDFIDANGGLEHVAPLILASRFSRFAGPQIQERLRKITGHDARDWFDWMLWQEQRPEIVPHEDYSVFKRWIFLQIDPNFDDLLRPEFLQRDRVKIRLEEITWGGVGKDGIPSLDNPELIDAASAPYLKPDDLVFGVSINGDTRAYPLRIMGWHEMFNEVIGGVPVALAYCTLCGSGILFETKIDAREEPLVFGSSGFLYRSNKLMFDRETNSQWNQFTGKPVSGLLVDSAIELKQRPVVISTWADWQNANPDTKVLAVETGYRRDYGSGVVYNDYFASTDLMFPVVVDQDRLQQKEYVFGIRRFGGAKAWPLDAFKVNSVINDSVAGHNVVLIGEPNGRTVRAYERGTLEFQNDPLNLVSNDGVVWEKTEDGLVGPTGETLPRVAGHIAYWFAWDSYLGANSEVYLEP